MEFAFIARPLQSKHIRTRVNRWPNSGFLVTASFRIYRLVAGTPSQYTITKLIEWA